MAHGKHPNSPRYSKHYIHHYFDGADEITSSQYWDKHYEAKRAVPPLDISSLRRTTEEVDTSKPGRPPTRTQYQDPAQIRKLLAGTNRHGKPVAIGARRKERMLKRLEELGG